MELLTYRKREGLTLAQLAERCGTKVSTLSGIERGARHASPKLARQIERGTDGEVPAKAVMNPDLAAVIAAEAAP